MCVRACCAGKYPILSTLGKQPRVWDPLRGSDEGLPTSRIQLPTFPECFPGKCSISAPLQRHPAQRCQRYGSGRAPGRTQRGAGPWSLPPPVSSEQQHPIRSAPQLAVGSIPVPAQSPAGPTGSTVDCGPLCMPRLLHTCRGPRERLTSRGSRSRGLTRNEGIHRARSP